MARNLTCRYLFKLYAGISATTDDTLIDYLIDWVSEQVEKYCDRTFEATVYRRWYSGTGTGCLALPNWPVTTLYACMTGTSNAATVVNSGAMIATVSVRNETMYLDSISTAGAETHSSIALSAKTMTTLAAAVALVSGWTMTVQSGFANYPAVLIRPVAGEDALSTGDVDIDVADDDPVEVYIPEESNQVIERPYGSVFPCGHDNIFVWYKAGYTLPVGTTSLTAAGDVPGDLTMTVNSIIKQVLEASKQQIGAMQSESFGGDYSYTLRQGASAIMAAAIKEHAAALTPHRSMKLA